MHQYEHNIESKHQINFWKYTHTQIITNYIYIEVECLKKYDAKIQKLHTIYSLI
jgi:hypothetical protein